MAHSQVWVDYSISGEVSELVTSTTGTEECPQTQFSRQCPQVPVLTPNELSPAAFCFSPGCNSSSVPAHTIPRHKWLLHHDTKPHVRDLCSQCCLWVKYLPALSYQEKPLTLTMRSRNKPTTLFCSSETFTGPRWLPPASSSAPPETYSNDKHHQKSLAEPVKQLDHMC